MKKPIVILSMLVLLSPLYGRTRGHDENTLVLPDVSPAVLDNGIRIYSIRDELPALTIIVTAGCGALYETSDNAGIGALLARTLSLSGSKSLPGNELNQRVESMGGRLSVSSSWENVVVSLTVLYRFRDEAFSLLGEFLASPAFSEESFRTARAIEVEDLKRKKDDPATIAFEEARRIIFDGKGYGSVAEPGKVGMYTLDQVKNHWTRHVAGANILIGISSPASAEEVKILAGKYFMMIPRGQRIEYSFDPLAMKRVRDNRNRIFYYSKDIPQATVVVGTVAPDVAYPGIPALSIMNYLLGEGSFNSNLMREIRVKRGLAYAVQSVLRPRWRTGVFLAYAGTKNATAGQVLSLMQEEIMSMGKNPPSEKDIAWVKKSIASSYIFEFDTPVALLTRHLDRAYNALPGDYLATWPDKISAVKSRDVKSEANRLFEPGLVRVIVGGAEARKTVEGMGEIVDLPPRP